MIINRRRSGGGIPLADYTVTFMAGDDVYRVISVKAGQSIDNFGDHFIYNGKYYYGFWTERDGQGTRIAFPYTPVSDVTVYGYGNLTAVGKWNIAMSGFTVTPFLVKIDYLFHVESGKQMETIPNTFEMLGVNFRHISAGCIDTSNLDSLVILSEQEYIVTYGTKSVGSSVIYSVPQGAEAAIGYYGTDESFSLTSRQVSLDITGGEDIHNPLLLQFLYEYCTLVS